MEGLSTAIHTTNVSYHPLLRPPTGLGEAILARIGCFRPSFEDKTDRLRLSLSSFPDNMHEKCAVRASKIGEILNSVYGERNRED